MVFIVIDTGVVASVYFHSYRYRWVYHCLVKTQISLSCSVNLRLTWSYCRHTLRYISCLHHQHHHSKCWVLATGNNGNFEYTVIPTPQPHNILHFIFISPFTAAPLLSSAWLNTSGYQIWECETARLCVVDKEVQNMFWIFTTKQLS